MQKNLVSKSVVLSLMHLYTERFFSKFGFQWEVRRRGELKLGLIRKKFLKNKKNTKPRRLVFIPGFGDTPLSWIGIFLPLLPMLRSYYDEIIWVDFPGFAGFLSHEKAFHSMDRLKESLFDALDSLEPDTLMGHSLGGWLSSAYASQNTAVKRLVLVCPGGVAIGEENQEYWKALFQNAKENGFESFKKHVFYREPFWFSLIQNGFMNFFSKEEILQFMESITEKDFLHSDLEKIKAQTYFIWGERDSLIPFAWVNDWVSKFKIEVSVFKLFGVGHSPQIEAPIQFGYILAKILRDRKISTRCIKIGKFKAGYTFRRLKTAQTGPLACA